MGPPVPYNPPPKNRRTALFARSMPYSTGRGERREGGRTKAEAKLFLSPPPAAGAGLRAGTTEEEEADVEELVVMMVMPVPLAWQAVRRVLLEGGGGGEAVAGGGRIEEVELAGKRSTRTHARLM